MLSRLVVIIAAPEIGDVLVLSNDENEQYVRVVDASKEAMAFMDDGGSTFSKDVVTVEIGNGLESDYDGASAEKSISFTTLATTISTIMLITSKSLSCLRRFSPSPKAQ